ncbi:MAG: hypothetical protein KF763_07735 [Cyclobacteriaceae bacterium]|nr:hypothetical protein [Cyclobacteriaceae bacterium]
MTFSKTTLAAASLGAVFFCFLTHEFAHWLMGKLIGYEMVMTLNTAYPKALQWNSTEDFMVVSVVGPAVTLLTSFSVYYIIRFKGNMLWFPFLFTCFYLELLSGIMNYRNVNDLGWLSKYLNIGVFTLPIIFVIIHFGLLYKTIVQEKYTRAYVLQTLGWILLFSSVWILANQKFKIILIS